MSELTTDAPIIGKVSPAGRASLPARDLDREPSVRAEAGAIGPLWVQACSIAGRSHTEGAAATSGQDGYSYRVSDDGRMAIFAITDGLGSRPRSHVGAHAAARQACVSFARPELLELFDGTLGAIAPSPAILDAISEVEDRIRAVDVSGGDGRDLATTLLVAVLRLDTIRPRAVFVRVGDPAAILMLDGRFTSRSLVFGPIEDGPANAVSACLPLRSASEVEVVRVGELPPGVSVVLVTDGVGNDLMASAELRTWFESRWSAPLDSAAMIDTLRYRRQGSVDDRTALVVLPAGTGTDRPPPPEPPPPPPEPPGPPGRRTRTRRTRTLAVAGAIVAVAALVVGFLVTRGGSPAAGTPLRQWTTAAGEPGIVVPTAQGVSVEVADPLVADGWVVTGASPGQLIAFDGCDGVRRDSQPAAGSTCEKSAPRLAVPDGDGWLVVTGDGARLLVDGQPPQAFEAADVPPDLDDAAVFGDGLILVGAGRALVVGADGQTALAPPPACSDAHYTGVERLQGDSAAVVATCADGNWAVAVVDAGATAPCTQYTGSGTAPVAVTTGSGVLLAFGDGVGALAATPIGADGSGGALTCRGS